MKGKNIFGILSIVGIILLGSCSKQEVVKDNYLVKLNEASAKYQQTNTRDLNEKTWKRFWKILGADLTGALGGAAIGSAIPGFGTTAGAILGGAGASCTAAGSTCMGPPPTGGNTSTENSFNPFDIVGEQHYIVLNQAYLNGNPYFTDDVFETDMFYNDGKNYMITNLSYSDDDFNAYTVTQNNSVIEHRMSNGDLNTVDYLQLLYRENMISRSVRDALLLYYNCFEVTTDVNAFEAYSISAENIIASSSMSEVDKSLVLCSMATARHGAFYWNGI